MLTQEELEALSNELNKTYSDQELSLHLTDRALKSVCEKMHAHNLALIQCVHYWRAHLEGRASEPEVKLWKALRPGRHAENDACNTLDELIDIAVGYGYGKVPSVPILVFASRSTTTLIDRLDKLHHTPHIDTMDATAREVFTLLNYCGSRKMSSEKFGAELRRLKDEFVKACAQNATELHGYIFGLKEKKKDTSPNVGEAVEKAQVKIVRAVEEEAKKTRRCVKKTAAKAVKEIRTNAQSDYDKRGPSSVARVFQLRAVIDRMREYRSDVTKLPKPLQSKQPEKWIRQACRDTWAAKDGGYPKLSSLYLYCHRNAEKILSLAGI